MKASTFDFRVRRLLPAPDVYHYKSLGGFVKSHVKIFKFCLGRPISDASISIH